MLIPFGGGFGLGGLFGSFLVDMEAILSAGTECKDSLWDSSGDRLWKTLPSCLLFLAVGENLQGHKEMAGTPEKPSFDPIEECGELHRNREG